MRGPFYNSVLEQGLFKYIYFKNIYLKKYVYFGYRTLASKELL